MDTAYGPTFVRVNGPAAAPPVVLLPGIGATSLMWAWTAGALATEYATFAVDNVYDYGRSHHTRPVRSADDFAAWLDSLLSALDLRSPVRLIGASYGGWIAAEYALRFPRRVERLALLAPAATVLPLAGGFIWRGILCAFPARYFMRNMMTWLAEDLARRDDAGRQIVDEMVEDGFVAARCFAARRLVPPAVLTDDQWKSLLPATLFLAGENEKLYPAAAAVERLRRVAPGVQAEIVKGAGHELFITQADQVNSRLLRFLRADGGATTQRTINA